VDDPGGESVVVLHRGSETVEHDGAAVPAAGHGVQLRTVAARRPRVTHARRVDALTAEVPAETFAIGAGLGTLRLVEQLGRKELLTVRRCAVVREHSQPARLVLGS